MTTALQVKNVYKVFGPSQPAITQALQMARSGEGKGAVLERTGATVVVKPVHTLKQRTEEEVRSRLGPDRWARANAAGRSTSIDALLKDIDRVFA